MVCQYLCKISISICPKINISTRLGNDKRGVKNKNHLLGSIPTVYYQYMHFVILYEFRINFAIADDHWERATFTHATFLEYLLYIIYYIPGVSHGLL